MTKTNAPNSVEYDLPSDWRGKVMTQIRTLIKRANPEVVEDVKYKTASNPGGVLVWYLDGLISTGEVYKKHLRLTLAKGQLLKDHDSAGLINSYRAILIHEEDVINETAFMNLIREAVKLNQEGKKANAKA